MAEYSEIDDFLVGAIEVRKHDGLTTPVRLPSWTHSRQPVPSLGRLAELPMGVRLRFRTRASAVVIHARLVAHAAPAGDAPPRLAVWVVTSGAGGRDDAVARVTSPVLHHADSVADDADSAVQSIRIPLGEQTPTARTVDVWLPHDVRVSIRSIEADDVLDRAEASERPRWLHYGSSISHGIDAVDAVSSWPVQAARRLDVELTSLAFAGNAMLDPFVADVIAERDVDVITLKVGINIVNAAAMNARTLPPALHGFLDRIRAAHPHVPIALITALACPMHEHAAGPTVWLEDGTLGAYEHPSPHEGQLTLSETRDIVCEVARARTPDDPRLFVVDGLTLLRCDEGHLLYDRLHPTQEGFDLIARRFARAVMDDADLSVAFGVAVLADG